MSQFRCRVGHADPTSDELYADRPRCGMHSDSDHRETRHKYAESDDDVIAVHRFLCCVAGPMLPGPIDGLKSATGVWRVANHHVALMAMRDDFLVGTLGLIRPEAIPGSKAWLPLVREAKSIAGATGVELHIISEERGKVIILNRRRLRDRHHSANSPNNSIALATSRLFASVKSSKMQ
jgi:hypothetical protein